jgi:hypothetical protein
MEEKMENNEQNGVESPAMKLMSKLQENRNSLHISRIPPKTKEIFIAFANEEFLGDYGMALKWLVDGIPSQDISLVIN